MSHRRIAALFAAAAAAALLLAVLVYTSGIGLDQFTDRLSALGGWQLLGCLLGIGLPVLLASVKWRSVVGRARPASTELPGFSFFVHFSALSGVLGQVVTPYVAGPIVRGMATRRAGHGGFLFGATTSVFEQFFDAWASLVFAGAGILLLIAGVPAELALWVYAGVSVLGALGAVILFALPGSTPVLTWLANRLPVLRRRLEDLMRLRERSSIVSFRFVTWLYWLSVLRFWVPGFAVIAITSTFAQDWPVASMLHVYAAAQITRFAVFTPGNLGLAEWGWTTVLAVYGWSFQSAALFALTFRVVGIVFTCIVYLGAATVHLALTRLSASEWRPRD